MNKKFICFLTCILILFAGIVCTGCDPIDSNLAKSGQLFDAFSPKLHNMYGVHLSKEEVPTVSIAYQSQDGTAKTAVFKLDGFDFSKKIGYKLVLKKDKEEWEESRKKGNIEAPDLNDAELIQQAAVRYEFPVLFMWAYQYQDELSQEQMSENCDEFGDKFKAIMSTPEMEKWAQDGLSNGNWTKESIEESCLNNFNIYFSHTDLPVVSIPYGDNKKAVFELDGYDAERQMGYKFVTADDEKTWDQQRADGSTEVPDLADTAQIKEAALNYDFPVLFMYVPEYWKTTFFEISRQELAEPLINNQSIKQWLEEHK